MDYRLQWYLFMLLSVALWNTNTVNGTGCSDIPCQNGGVCFDQPNDDFFCLCIVGFTGRTCIGDVETAAPPTIAPTTVAATTTKPDTTTVATTMKPTTEYVEPSTKAATTTRPPPSSTLPTSAPKSTSETEAAPAGMGSTESSDKMAEKTTPKAKTKSTEEVSKIDQNVDKPDNNTVSGDDRGNYRWFLFLILFVMLVIAAIITLWAVKRSAKSHNQSADYTAYYSLEKGSTE